MYRPCERCGKRYWREKGGRGKLCPSCWNKSFKDRVEKKKEVKNE